MDKWHLIYVDGWDQAAGEAKGGGRTIETLPTLTAAAHAYRQWLPICLRLYGHGLLLLTDDDGTVVDVENLLELLCDAA